MVAELHGIRIGLTLAWERGFRLVECEVDALLALQLLESADLSLYPLAALIGDIRQPLMID
ncbi:hypothetical protein COLO4_01678 [Corchorus olitorius]|uniref:RNase H type-1 domain-containing protein n=1 Tax=Corchorus olitorius TaxID=93759 RepID=A0A1R3L258_9ROSI|nr:hypothetical protein COLO4_01678 [Corchorus olitorius]